MMYDPNQHCNCRPFCSVNFWTVLPESRFHALVWQAGLKAIQRCTQICIPQPEARSALRVPRGISSLAIIRLTALNTAGKSRCFEFSTLSKHHLRLPLKLR